MTKKHFKELADGFKRLRPEGEFTPERQRLFVVWAACTKMVAGVCESANPRFDRERFLTAAGYFENNDTIRRV